jgi:hypothetical protein
MLVAWSLFFRIRNICRLFYILWWTMRGLSWRAGNLLISWKLYSMEFISLLIRCKYVFRTVGRDSSVDVATRYGLDGPVIESRWGWDFPHLPKPALGAIQPPIQWVLALSWGLGGRSVGLTTHPHLAPIWAFGACSRVKFTFTVLFSEPA